MPSASRAALASGTTPAMAKLWRNAPRNSPPASRRANNSITKAAAPTVPTGEMRLGAVHIPKGVKADGKPLPSGTYQVRLSTDTPKPAIGQSPEGERYVEFLRSGKVVGRELATVISDADAKAVVKGPAPARGGSRVDLLKGNS